MHAYHVSLEQGSPEWFAARAGLITASRFKVLMNGTETALQRLLEEVRSAVPKPQVRSQALAWGLQHEATAIREYELAWACTVKRCGMFRHLDLRAACSPDGLVFCGGNDWAHLTHGVEVKCPWNQKVHEKTLEFGMPDEHLPQVQGAMWIIGCQHWDFISFDPRRKGAGSRLFVQRIPRDETFIRRLESRVRWFHELLVSGRDVHEPKRNVDALLLGDGDIDLF